MSNLSERPMLLSERPVLEGDCNISLSSVLEGYCNISFITTTPTFMMLAVKNGNLDAMATISSGNLQQQQQHTINKVGEEEDINSQNEHGQTALMMCKDFITLDHLLHLYPPPLSINLNYQDEHGYTALIYYCKIGQYDCARFLIEKGADVNLRDNNHYNAGCYCLLNCSSSRQAAAMLSLMIEKGMTSANISQLLFVFSKNYNARILQMLLDAGADINTTNHGGKTPLLVLAESNHHISKFQLLEQLIQAGADIHRVDQFKNNYLHLVMSHMDCDHIITIPTDLAILNQKNDLGMTPLVQCLNSHCLTLPGYVAAEKIISVPGVDLTLTNCIGLGAFHYMVSPFLPVYGHFCLSAYLDAADADVSSYLTQQTYKKRIIPGIFAQGIKSLSLIKKLMACGLTPDYKSLCVTSMLQWAIQQGHIEIAHLLIENHFFNADDLKCKFCTVHTTAHSVVQRAERVVRTLFSHTIVAIRTNGKKNYNLTKLPPILKKAVTCSLKL